MKKVIAQWMISLMLLVAVGAIILCASTELSAASKPNKNTDLVLAVSGQARAVIVEAKNATSLERQTARDLAGYLQKITGASFPIVEEGREDSNRTCIYVGRTKAAGKIGIVTSALHKQEWIVKSESKSLFLVGGDPRGTSYAVYHFLEDILGVRWWNPYEEYVPKKPRLVLKPVNLRNKPVFERRCLGGEAITQMDSGEPFIHRNRVFGQGEQYGIGGAYFVHTFHYYVPYTMFQQHPEWFAFVDGKRSNGTNGGNFGLCLTNHELWAAILEKLTETIEADRKNALETHTDAPTIYSVSQNDNAPCCQCPECTAILTREGSQAGPLLEMLNYVAAGVKKEYPDITIETLAYTSTLKPPAKMKPLSNVRIRVCLGARNIVRPLEDVSNRDVLKTLREWCRISSNVGLWLYSYSYGGLRGLPCPVERFMAEDMRLFKRLGVRDVYFQHEYDFYRGNDWVFWMRSKLLENPGLDQEVLLKEFTDGYYGPAGKYIREYVNLLDKASHRKNYYVWTLSPVSDFGFLDLQFFFKANDLFNRAAIKVANNSVLSRRVRNAQLPVDRALLALWPSLFRSSQAEVVGITAPLPNRDTVVKRYKRTMQEQIALRCIPRGHDRKNCLAFYEDELKLFNANARVSAPVPSKFKNIPPNSIFDYPANSPTFILEGSDVRIIQDNKSETGSAIIIPMDDSNQQFVTSLAGNGALLPKRSINISEISTGHYSWYDLGSFTVSSLSGTQICLGQNGQVKLSPQENGTYEVWISIKSNGPSFLPENTDKINSISIDRVVLVKPVIAGDATISNKWTVFTPLSRTDTFSTEILKSIPQQVTVGSKTIKPQFADVAGGSIDLASMMGGSVKDRSAFVFTTVIVRKTGKLTFGFGADWWLQAWLDGELICDTTTMGNPAYPPSMKDNIVTVPVVKGEHTLAVRFINGEASSLLAVGAGGELRRAMKH